ncbi:hypothetical protein SDC9_174627 [bioreactor metagenome]|uniref:Uncharacterized protein n=1 Tax=bioreactor metagenome TaxID=1076179 RepID=A0A645GM04_9ZZZZ
MHPEQSAQHPGVILERDKDIADVGFAPTPDVEEAKRLPGYDREDEQRA